MLKQRIPYSKKGEALVRLRKLKSYQKKKKITRPLPLKHQTIAGEQRLFGKAVGTLGRQEAPGIHFMSYSR